MPTFWKTSKGDRLRAERTARTKAKTALTALYRKVYRRDHYRCVACGKPVVVGSTDELKRAHPHHVRPRSLVAKALKHTSANICCLCPICHADIGHTLFISGNADTRLTIRRTKVA